MPIAKELALKILGALAVGGTAVGGGIALKNLSSKKTETENNASEKPGKGDKTETQGDNTPAQDQKGDGAIDDKKAETPPKKDPDTSKILEELGLSCGADNICSLITNKKLSVKQDNKTGTLTALPASATGVGKIKIHKAGDEETKSTFSIEEGDISPSWGSGATITKLEEFETYEIEEEGEEGSKKYHFKRSLKALEGKAKVLGLTGSNCSLPTGANEQETSTCDLDLDKLKAINFEGKTKGKEPTITGGGKVTLTITKLKANDTYSSKYPMGYQFTLSGEKEVKIPASPKEIVKKGGVSLEFKIKKSGSSLTLERVSQLDRLAGKLGFTECNSKTKTCKFPNTSTLNVYRDKDGRIVSARIKSYSDQTISFEEDVDDYEGGVKFTLDKEIELDGGVPNGTMTRMPAASYEIKEQSFNNQTH